MSWKDCLIKNVSERSELRYEVCGSDLMILSHQKCCLNHQTLKESAGVGAEIVFIVLSVI